MAVAVAVKFDPQLLITTVRKATPNNCKIGFLIFPLPGYFFRLNKNGSLTCGSPLKESLG
jgi:hypothetical protein